MADLVTRKVEMELSIGQTIQVGTQFLTVIDIEEDEILFQLDSENPLEQNLKSVQESNSHTRSCR